VSNVSFADAGDYYIVASNFVGIATSLVAHVTVAVPTNAGAVDNAFRPPIPVPATISDITAAAIQSDGKVLIARAGAIDRLLGDGAFDPAFKSDVQASGNVYALALQSDGRIIALGDFSAINGVTQLRIARLEHDGTLDPSFPTPLSTPNSVRTLAVQSDDHILYGADNFLFSSSIILSRLLPTGALDPTFRTVSNPDGFITVSNYTLRLQPDGKILFGSSSGFFRLLPHGTRDLSFQRTNLTDIINGPHVVAVQSDGRIIVGGVKLNSSERCLFRLHADGSIDSAFNPGPTGTRISAIIVQPDGRIVVGGAFTNIQGVARNGLARLHAAGMLDPTFDAGAGPLTNRVVRDILRKPTGELIVIGGFTQFDDYNRPGIAQLIADPPATPAILTSPVSQMVHDGQFVSFFAHASCQPPGAFQWQFNGATIEGANDLSLRIDSVHFTNAGSYTFIASNIFGAVTSAPAILSVSPAPVRAGAVDPEFYPGLGADGHVLAAVRQPDGKIIIGGAFTRVAGVPRNCVARLNADGSLDPAFAAGSGVTNVPNAFPPMVRAVALQPDGKVIIGGRLGYVDGQARESIARLGSDGTLDAGFADQLENEIINALLLQSDGKVFFGASNGRPYGRLNTDGSRDLQWSAYSFSSSIHSLVQLSGGEVMIGGLGGFFSVRTNGLWEWFFTQVGGTVHSIALLENAIVVGGDFTNAQSVTRRYLAAFDYNRNLLSNAWGAINISHPVRALTKDSCGRLLVAGAFTNVNGQACRGLVRFLPDGILDSTFNPAPEFDGEPYALISQSDSHFLAVGEFTEVGGTSRRGVARFVEEVPGPPVFGVQPGDLMVDAGRDFSLSASVECPYRTFFQWQWNGMDIPGETNATLSYVNVPSNLSGTYRIIASNENGSVTSTVASVTIRPETAMPGNIDIDFFPVQPPTNSVRAIGVQSDGKVLVAGLYRDKYTLKRFNPDGMPDGTFDHWLPFLNPQPLPKLIVPEAGDTTLVSYDSAPWLRRVNSDGTLNTNFSVITDGPINAVHALRDGNILLAGDFSQVNSRPSPGVARLSSSGLVDTNFGAQLPSILRATAIGLVPDGRIVVARRFQGATAINRFENSGVLDAGFPSVYISNFVHTIAVQSDGKFVVAGDFTNFNGSLRPHLIRLNTNGTLDLTFASVLQPGEIIAAFAMQPDDKILITTTNRSGGTPLAQAGILRLHRNGAVDTTFDPRMGADRSITALALSPGGNVYLGGAFSSYDGFPRPFLARAHGDPEVIDYGFSTNCFRVSIYTDLDRTYYLEFKPGLNAASWQVVQTLVGTGSIQVITDPNIGGANGFYRVRVE
jgi:uncharacterized delta-60 repeat protein